MPQEGGVGRRLVGDAFFIGPGTDGRELRRTRALCGIVQEAARDFEGLRVKSWFGEADPGLVMFSVVRSIAEAPVVVADLTGANANVYYEIGLAHAFRRPVLAFIIEEQRPQFDLGQQRAIPVRLDERGDLADKEALQDKVRAALVDLDVDKGDPATVVDTYLDARELKALRRQKGDVATPSHLGFHDDIRFAALRGWLRQLTYGELVAGVRVVDVELGSGVVEQCVRDATGTTINVVYDNGTVLSRRINSDDELGLFRAPR